MCEELLSSGKMDTATIQFDKIDAKQEFTAYVSRGGLMKPSDVVYITCTLAYAAYKSIKNCDEAFLTILLILGMYFMNSVEDITHLSLESEC